MSTCANKSLFSLVNFFRKASQTWAATKQSDSDGLDANGCRVEPLEARVLMSAAVLHQADLTAGNTPNPHAEQSSRVLHAKLKTNASAPAAPTSLSASPLSATSVQLTWTDGDSLATGFLVLRGTDGVHFTTISKITSASAVTYTDTTALSAHTYDYEVEELTGTIASSASSMTTASTPLAAPATLTATATGPTVVKLAWGIDEPQAGGYYVLRSTDGTNFSQIAQLPTMKAGSYSDTSAAPSTQYTYEIQSFKGGNTSAASRTAVATTPLSPPSALSATYLNAAVNLAWTNNDANATGYLVFRSGDGKTFTQIASVTGQSTAAYADSTALTGHSYTYKLEACAGSNKSAFSTVTTISTPLTAPSNLNATPNSPTKVALAWTDNDPNATSYSILRSADGVHFTQIAKVTGASAAAYVDSTATSGKTYSYQVKAVAGTIISDATNTVTVTLALTAPATVTATAISPTSVKVVWSVSDNLATGYLVLRSPDGTNFTQIATVTGKTTATYTDTVSSATEYIYEVQATDTGNSSAVSKTATVTTPLIPTSNESATLSGSAVNLAWTDNDSAATGYNVLSSSDGTHFTLLTTLTDPNAASYSDATILTGHAYTYEVQAIGSGTLSSTAVKTSAVTVPLVSPSALATTVLAANSVHLSWTDNDVNATGYLVLRSTDGTHFTQIAKLTTGTAATYTDAAAAAGKTSTYEIEAANGTILSPASATASATTPLITPNSLKATAAGPTTVKLTWANVDALSTGYNILRSTDGVNYSTLAQITSNKTAAYSDTTASSDTTYYYEVQTTNVSNQSATSAAATVTTPLVAISALAATAQPGSVALTWTDNDSNAAGYYVLRVNGKTITQLASLTDPNASGYTDTTALSGHAYSYEVQACNGSVNAAMSAAVLVSTPLVAPSSLEVTSATATKVQLAWTNNDVNALGYDVLRSTDGTHFTQIAALTSATAATYSDSNVATGTSYTYEVKAYAGTIVSAVSNTATTTTLLATPTSFTATLIGAYIGLSWANSDVAATSYNILRSTDGVTFTQFTTTTSKTYVDTSVAGGQTYFYQVQATNGTLNSAISASASAATPNGNVTSGVSVVTRFGDELVITAAGTSDSISVTESGSTLTITGDGQTFTDAAPAGGTFIYTRGGSDSIVVDSSVTSALTIDSIDAATTVINSNGSAVNAWVDSTDTLIGSATAHKVASFAGNVTKALSASLANPKDAGTTAKDNLSLFGTGPVAADVNQGSVGDCYFLASLAAFANQSPQTLVNSAVDLGDGTYCVQFIRNSTPVFVRVNNSFTTGGFGGYSFAHPGVNNTIWAAVMEKAFAYFRTGANTYNSINSGWMDEVYADLGVRSADINPASFSDNALFNLLSNDLSSGDAVTFGTQNAPNLVQSHAYTLLSVNNTGGVNHYVVRNPWGSQGDSLENSMGIATLTYAQFVANFVSGTAASN